MLSPHLTSRLRKIDWDFAGSQSESPFSALHWYPARFASQLPAALIGLLTEHGQLVLDPFSGSGTTLVEAQRLSRRSVGVDLSPIACRIARAKTLAVPSKQVEKIARALKDEAASELSDLRPGAENLPCTVQSKWYTPHVRRGLVKLWNLVRSYRADRRTLAEAAFSAILLPVCRETRHWGYVCDNSTPAGDHSGDVLRRYCEVLDGLTAAYEKRDVDIAARSGGRYPIQESTVICGDARAVLGSIAGGSADLLLTSPPYFGVSDYIKAQRLSMEWFGLEIEGLRRGEIGARSKRHRLTSVTDYASEIGEVFRKARPSLKEGAPCVVIIGESSARESVHGIVLDALQAAGFALRLDLNRRVSSQRRQAPSIVGEHILLFSAS